MSDRSNQPCFEYGKARLQQQPVTPAGVLERGVALLFSSEMNEDSTASSSHHGPEVVIVARGEAPALSFSVKSSHLHEEESSGDWTNAQLLSHLRAKYGSCPNADLRSRYATLDAWLGGRWDATRRPAEAAALARMREAAFAGRRHVPFLGSQPSTRRPA